MTDSYVLKKIMNYADKHGENIIPTQDEPPFLIMDTNNSITSRIGDILDIRNIEHGFDDEYAICEECNKAIRTQADSYHWKADFNMGDGFIICGDCVRSETAYIEDYLSSRINNPGNCNTLLDNDTLERQGFKRINGYPYETGFFSHMDDDPTKIYDELKDKYRDILFSLAEQSQFYLSFDVYGKEGLDAL